MSRGTDGRKLVAFGVSAILGTIGVGTIYLPFMANRDKLRGFSEEGVESMPEGARREIQALAKAEAAEHQQKLLQKQQQQEQQQDPEEEVPQQRQRPKASGGSMWSSFRRN